MQVTTSGPEFIILSLRREVPRTVAFCWPGEAHAVMHSTTANSHRDPGAGSGADNDVKAAVPLLPRSERGHRAAVGFHPRALTRITAMALRYRWLR